MQTNTAKTVQIALENALRDCILDYENPICETNIEAYVLYHRIKSIIDMLKSD